MSPSLSAAIEAALATGYAYPAYRELLDRLLAQNTTTGPEPTATRVADTRMNLTRMNRWDKTTVLSAETLAALRTISAPQTWVLIVEGWCGDASQNVSIIQHMANATGGLVNVVFVLRDENPALMDHFLTNGGRAIPKLIALNANHEVLWQWGPRPAELIALVDANKALPEDQRTEKGALIHGWYAKNKGVALQQELSALISGIRQ